MFQTIVCLPYTCIIMQDYANHFEISSFVLWRQSGA